MAINRTFTFSDGTTVELLEVPALVIEHILNSEAGKPAPPIVEEVIRGHKRKTANPDHPAYLEQLRIWQAQKQKRLLVYLSTKGVKDDPPEEFVEEYEQFLPPGATLEDFKYLWLANKLQDNDEIAAFAEAIASQTAVTAEGLTESAAQFRSDSEWNADPGVEVPEAAESENQLSPQL